MFEYLPFLDSFDHYQSGDMTGKWLAPSGSIVSGGRNGKCFGGINSSALKSFSIGYASIFASVAYRTYGFANHPLGFGSMGDSSHLRLEHYGDGRFRVWGGAETSGPLPWVMAQGSWNSLQLGCEIATLGGNSFRTDWEFKANDVSIASGSWTRTIPGFEGRVNMLSMVGSGGGVGSWWDDLCVFEDEFPGDLVVAPVYTNANGDVVQFTPVGAGEHWDLVNDDDAPDYATTYLRAAVGQREMHRYQDVGDVEIRAVQCLDLVRKMDTGLGSVQSVMKIGGSEYNGGVTYPSETSWWYFREGFRKDPITSVDWTVARFNALQRGLDRVT